MKTNIIALGARKCRTESIEKDLGMRFVEENHRQGSAAENRKIKSLGLFYGSDLVAVAQFCSPRTSRKKREYTTELLRLCFKDGYRIQGGASKLIKAYIKKFQPSDIFTYQDMTGEQSDVYEHSGFVLVEESRRKKYYVAPGKDLKNALRKEYYSFSYVAARGPDALLGTSIGEKFHDNGKRKTNLELFDDLGWHVEETRGDRVYEWVNKSHTHYVYKITASDSSKYYYGVSHVKKENANQEDCLMDGYYGSGGQKFSNWSRKHSDHLQKEVLGVFDRKAEAYLFEKKLVGDLYKEDPLCLNTREGGFLHGISASHFRTFDDQICSIHGKTAHLKDRCCSCIVEASISLKDCVKHGLTKHIGDTCYSCMQSRTNGIEHCTKHGDSQHIANRCRRCINESTNHIETCTVHGETLFQGDSCAKCNSLNAVVIKRCSVHNETAHQGESCRKCVSESTVSTKSCDVHGDVKHIGDTCYSCFTSERSEILHCEVHGMVKHVKNVCCRCSAKKSVSIKKCKVHGDAKHIGDTCYLCRKTVFYMDTCSIHGNSKHRSGLCVKCSYSKMLAKEKQCTVCGKTFSPTSNRQKVCLDEHLVDCPRCGRPMDYKKNHCSMSCAIKASNERKDIMGNNEVLG